MNCDCVSIVVPFLNECEGIERFCGEIDNYASTLEFGIELILVDDGSTDNTVDIILAYKFKNIYSAKLIRLSRNYGMHAAIRAGLQYTSSDICTWMGCDLQEPFDFIAKSYNKILEGYDAVYIDRKTLRVSVFNRFFSTIYTYLIRHFAVKNYTDGGTSIIVFNLKIKEYLNDNVETNSLLMLQIIDAGFKHCTLSLDFGERQWGKSRWSISKKIKVFIDSFVSFSFMPIRLVSIVGIIMFVAGLVDGIVILIRYFAGITAPLGYPTIVSLLVMGFGITNISLGIIAEYLWRTYDAARNRPAFIVSEEIDVK